jgi:DNA modification methylase
MCSIAFLIGKNAYDIEMTEPIETTRNIDTLSTHPRNYNQHPPTQIARIAKSLVQFGQVRPIVVHRDTIIAGHGVWMAATALVDPVVNEAMLRGYVFDDTTHTYEQWCEHRHDIFQSLRVTQLPDDWTEEQAMAYLVADNETRRGAEPDDAGLAALLDELQQADFDIAAMGFDDAEYSALLDGLTPEPPDPGNGGDEFEPDENAPCRVQPGDVWLIGGVHRLICGDCTDPATVERLMQGEEPFLMVTDPPYGVNYDANWRNEAAAEGHIAYAAKRVGNVSNDHRVDWTEAYALFKGDVAYCWHNAFRTSSIQSLEACGFELRSQIIWAKPNFSISRGHYHWRHEPCWYAVRKGTTARWAGDRQQTTVWDINLDKNIDGGHSTQKPMECMARPIRNHGEPDDLVYDPFLGSGTTIIAAHRTGRRCYGCEISPEYCEVILQRCEAEGLTVERVEQG